MPDYKRMGQMKYIEDRLEQIERELNAFADDITDKLFALNSHLDTDGPGAFAQCKRYVELQREGVDLRAKLEAMKTE